MEHIKLTPAQARAKLQFGNTWREVNQTTVGKKMIERLVDMRILVSREIRGVQCCALKQLTLIDE